MAKSSSYRTGQVLKSSAKGKRAAADRVAEKSSSFDPYAHSVSSRAPRETFEVERVHARSGKFSGKGSKPDARRDAERTLVRLSPGVSIEIADRADVVAKALGSRAKLAQVLKVSASQPTRWIKGEEAPNSENTRTIVDLEHVVTRARLLWGDDEVVNAWLTGRNGFLDGARPIDVIGTQGSGPVIDALDQSTAGAFA